MLPCASFASRVVYGVRAWGSPAIWKRSSDLGMLHRVGGALGSDISIRQRLQGLLLRRAWYGPLMRRLASGPSVDRPSDASTPLFGVAFASLTVASAILLQRPNPSSNFRRHSASEEVPAPSPWPRAFLPALRQRLLCEARWRLALERLPDVVVLPKASDAASAPGSDVVPPQLAAALPTKLLEAFSPLSSIFTTFFEHISSATLPEAMQGLAALLVKDSLDQKQKQNATTEPCPEHSELLQDALRYMRLSSAAYGHLIINPLMFPDKALLPSSLDIINDPAAMICDHARLDRASIRVLHSKSSSSWLQPAHYVVHDVQRREAIVLVRGTLSVEDVITDLGAEEVDFFLGGKAHRNILQSACNVLRLVAPVLEQLAGEVDTVTFTGHSLGGGVAAYSALVCSELLDGGAGSSPGGLPQVKCFTFGAPGLCCLEVSQSLRGCITSVCNAYDVVPRLSFGHVLELHDRAMAASNGARGRSTPRHSRAKLYPAGRCVLVQPDGVLAELEPEALAPHISLAGGRRLVSDHFPPMYEAALSAGLARSADVAARL